MYILYTYTNVQQILKQTLKKVKYFSIINKKFHSYKNI
uniref:Uncharacterized protein n=1 Tax=Thuretia quercifolia TaxID=189650 RepID=A0A1Z1MKI7_9FLOR|nr:hypothetical protein [Thuretia quercifolia]ARW66456.1 hypothetical protein [Thuretia quercifolia]